jgi:hypothetical protein
LLVVCSGCSEDAPSVIVVYGEPESTRLEVSVNTCNRHPIVDAEETPDEVRLTITADDRENAGDCADGDDVTLEAPLGDRVVIDESTGEQVEVAPLED